MSPSLFRGDFKMAWGSEGIVRPGDMEADSKGLGFVGNPEITKAFKIPFSIARLS